MPDPHSFVDFLLGRFWHDIDSNAVGGRRTLVFVWVMILYACSGIGELLASCLRAWGVL